MKRLTRILVTLMLACTLIPATPAFAGGTIRVGDSWDKVQEYFGTGGGVSWSTSTEKQASFTITVRNSTNIYLNRDHATITNKKSGSMFSLDNNNVDLDIDKRIQLQAEGSATGGIVYVKCDNCTIENFNVVKGKTKGKYAGAIYVEGNNCTIKNCDFTDCSSGYCGGAIYVDGDGCTIEDCTFNKCSSQYGGAIYLEGYGTEINRCTFTSCEATRDGGAIYANDDAQIKDNCTFKNNIAKEGYGGAICDDNGPGQVVISDCNFEGGSCGKYGIWIYGWGDAKVERCTPSDSDHYYDIEDIDSTLVSSIFSSGNIWIIGGVGVIAIAAIVLIALKRRKKTA